MNGGYQKSKSSVIFKVICISSTFATHPASNRRFSLLLPHYNNPVVEDCLNCRATHNTSSLALSVHRSRHGNGAVIGCRGGRFDVHHSLNLSLACLSMWSLILLSLGQYNVDYTIKRRWLKIQDYNALGAGYIFLMSQ